MRSITSKAVILVLAMTAAGCTKLQEEFERNVIEAEIQASPNRIRPGLEPLLYRRDTPPDSSDTDERPDPNTLLDPPFPMVELSWNDAESLLAGDAVALRFLALKRLGMEGLADPYEVVARRGSNIGALLPLSQPILPAASITSPGASPTSIVKRFEQLYDKGKGNADTRRAERAFLLDALMPTAKAPRGTLPKPDDLASARKAGARLDRLRDAGIISAEEHEAETVALRDQITRGELPETLIVDLPPPPPPPPPKKTAKKSGAGRPVGRMEGGVSGKFEVIPSPPQVSAPKLAAGSTGPAGLHLLSMGTAIHAEKAFEALKKEFPDLAPLAFTVSKAELGELGATYRLIAGPTDSANAEKICADIRAKGQSCQATPFPK